MVAKTRDSIESPVLAPRVAWREPDWRESRCVRPSWEPTATTVLVGFMAKDVRGPDSKRVSRDARLDRLFYHRIEAGKRV